MDSIYNILMSTFGLGLILVLVYWAKLISLGKVREDNAMVAMTVYLIGSMIFIFITSLTKLWMEITKGFTP